MQNQLTVEQLSTLMGPYSESVVALREIGEHITKAFQAFGKWLGCMREIAQRDAEMKSNDSTGME